VRYVPTVKAGQLLLGLGSGEAGGGEDALVQGDEETFAAGEDGSVGALQFGLVEEFAVGSSVRFGGSVQVAGYEHEGLVERRGF